VVQSGKGQGERAMTGSTRVAGFAITAVTMAVVGGGALAQQVAPIPVMPLDPRTALAQIPMVHPIVTVVHPVVTVEPAINVHPKLMFVGAAQAKDDLLAGTEKFAKGASKVTEINLDPSTMSMMDERGRDAEMARKMDLMVVHTYAYDKPGMYRPEDVEAYRKKLQDGSWSCSVHVRENEKSTDICSRSVHETNEMVIITADAQKLTFIHMKGKMPLNDLSNMSGGGREMRKWNKPSAPPAPPVPPKSPTEPTPPTPPTPPM
jgi:hypothetical protein